jgi:hypothetical protein
MKDNLAVLIVAAAFAGLAWCLWHFLGQEALDVLILLALIGTVADNIRLRRRLDGK